MDRITRVTIKNVRAIQYVELDIARPLTVLIGENGSGKSTIIECLELLRKVPEQRFLEHFYVVHRGLHALLRKGASALELGVVVEDDAGKLPRVEYAFALAPQGAGAAIQSERLLIGPMNRSKKPRVLLRRTGDQGELLDEKTGKKVAIPAGGMSADQLLISSFGKRPPHEAIDRLLAVLRGIETHLGFETLAAWAARSHQRPVSVRASATLFPADRLNLLGVNLASAWTDLRGRDTAHWEKTMALVRLGLGERVDSVTVAPDMGGGNVYLALRFIDLPEPVFASDLSDGQLAWLAFVAMARLNTNRSFLAVDEPELHLHPALLGRVVILLANLDGGAPALLSTHADRVLELLDDPAGAVRVCSLEGSRAVISRIDTNELPKWLEQFGDLGHLRANGLLPLILTPSPGEAEGTGGGNA